MEYTHERAVADGVNVRYEVYRIRTEATERGGKVEKGWLVDKRSKDTREVRWQRLDEDLEYEARELDRSVIVLSQTSVSPVSSRSASIRRSRCAHLSWAPTPVSRMVWSRTMLRF